MSNQSLIENVRRTLRRYEMLCDARGAVLAVSGGPDSLAMLHAVKEICERDAPALLLHVGHLHHGQRGVAADEDARFVEAQAARLGIGCTVERRDVPALARERGIGIEEAGREVRYEFLIALARAKGADRILTGHHGDDQAETILLRVRRGAGPRGLGGIPYVRSAGMQTGIQVARPLLDCTRAEIEAFLRDRGLAGRLDATNLDPRYARNVVRAQILPAMAAQWPGDLRASLRRLAGSAQRLRAAGEPALAHWSDGIANVEQHLVEIDLSRMRRLPASLLAEALRPWLRAAGLDRRMIASAHYAELERLLACGRGVVALPGDLSAEIHRDILAVFPAAPPLAPDIELAMPGETVVAALGVYIQTEIIPGGIELLEHRAPDGSEEYLDADHIAPPLRLRGLRPGDRMRPIGATGTRKLSDILTDLHIPHWRKARAIVVTAADRPIWIVGYRVADGAMLTPATRNVLRLRRLSNTAR